MKREVTLAEMREIQLDILRKVHKFCIEHSLRYSLGGGTLLGAIRHKGYIPWDDDIDIMMPRPDYTRFLQEFEGVYSHLSLQHFGNDITCWIPFAKVYDNRTYLRERYQQSGVYIDVFPIDGLPKQEKINAFIKKYNYLLYRIIKTTPVHLVTKTYLTTIKYYIKRLLFLGRNEYLHQFFVLVNENPFDTSENAGAICGVYGEKEIMRKDIFESFISVPFEGGKYMAIKEYDKYLKQHYGDYMSLPPKEKQVSHHEYKAYWR